MPIASDAKYILEVVYGAGLHDERNVHNMVKELTNLSLKQVSQWFRTKRWQDNKNDRPIPSRKNPRIMMNPQNNQQKGEWNAEKRKILEVCFAAGFCLVENFPFIQAITGLAKSQISNWTRQKRFRLRKKGLMPPFEDSRKRKRLATREFNKNWEHYNDLQPPSKKRKVAPVLKHPSGDVDAIAVHILQNAWDSGCLDQLENLSMVSLLAGCNEEDVRLWIKGCCDQQNAAHTD